MSSLSRARRTVLAAAAIALPLSLLPLASASADPAPPQFVYQDISSAPYARVLFSANADGSSPTSLLPAGYQVRSFDVTPDGQTELLGLCHGKPADCANRSTTNAWLFNTVYSLVLVHHDAVYGTKSRVLTSSWDTNPSLTDDGRPVWMTDNALYRLDVDYSTAAWATSTTPPDKSVAWSPPSGGFTDALTVSSDGSEYAVLQENAAGTTFNVRAGSFLSPSTGPRLFVSYASTDARLPSTENFRFVMGDLAYSAYQPADLPDYTVGGQDYYPIYTEIGRLDTSGGTHTENTALKNTYAIRWNPDANGWYVWKDHSDGTKDVSALALVTGAPETSGTTTVGTFTDRSNGDTTTGYTPAASTPPVLSAADTASNRTPAHPYMALRSSVVASNAVNYFWVENDFYQDPMLAPFNFNNSVLTSVGELQYSYDKVHWLHSVNTQGASQKKVGTFTSMGSTQKLTRNTWFRWFYKGDLMTAAGSTSARLVKVAPTITVKIATASGKRTVYGSVLRSRGKIELLHKVGTKWKAVATVAISSKGAYTFGKRVLAKGTYEVVSLADAGWAASSKAFKI